MFLSRLVLRGFKSYSDRVVVDFGPHIAVIIGSNGVGKSNALEGVVWALGEDNLSALRCRSSQDFLFCGSHEAGPAREALVELTFDNNGTEHHVSRWVHASGEEKFFVGGKGVTSSEEYKHALNDLGLGFAIVSRIEIRANGIHIKGESKERRDATYGSEFGM